MSERKWKSTTKRSIGHGNLNRTKDAKAVYYNAKQTTRINLSIEYTHTFYLTFTIPLGGACAHTHLAKSNMHTQREGEAKREVYTVHCGSRIRFLFASNTIKSYNTFIFIVRHTTAKKMSTSNIKLYAVCMVKLSVFFLSLIPIPFDFLQPQNIVEYSDKFIECVSILCVQSTPYTEYIGIETVSFVL